MQILLWVSTLLFSFPLWAQTRTEVCGIQIESQEKIEFTDTEKSWLCGTPESPSWQDSPPSQKILFLRSFLQSRGYHQPLVEAKAGLIHIKAGPLSRLETLEIRNAPENWNWKKRRFVKNRPFTPDLLAEFTKWSQRRLLENGYPCTQVSAQAIVDEEIFILNVEEDEISKFGLIETRGESDLDPKILDRYSAYFEGSTFDVRLLEITSNRILADDLYLSAYFDIICGEKKELEIIRRLVPAKPHLLTFGLGFDSEGGFIFRSLLKKSRLNEKADSLQLSLYASFIEQSLVGNYKKYFLNDLRSRTHLLVTPSIKHEEENNYETLILQLGTSLAIGWEASNYSGYAKAGPVGERLDLIAETGNDRIDTLKFETEVNLISHLFEYYALEPQDGWSLTLRTSTHFHGSTLDENVHQLQIHHHKLWNLWQWDPALLILGWRGSLGAFLTAKEAPSTSDIPINRRFFLGGESSVRGFSRQQLPFTSEGFLSILYQGLELRMGQWLPYNLQPFILFDFAKGGHSPKTLSHESYYSTGLGLRWASPFGTLRGTAAKGFMSPQTEDADRISNIHFLLSFGREF